MLLAIAGLWASACQSGAAVAKSSTLSPGPAKAAAAFAEHSAPILQLPLRRVQVVQPFPHTVNGALGFTAFPEGKWDRSVHGWATADGTVIAHHTNLGRLFVEAGLWTSKPSRDAKQLAEELIWSFGENHMLTDRVLAAEEDRSPVLALDGHGAGTLKFIGTYRQPGPGGAGGGPIYVYEYTVTLTADHQAQLARSVNLNGGADPPAGCLPW
jgi:hypothetical protein